MTALVVDVRSDVRLFPEGPLPEIAELELFKKLLLFTVGMLGFLFIQELSPTEFSVECVRPEKAVDFYHRT